MSDKPKDLAARAGKQAQHAAQNSGRAVEAAAEEVVNKTTSLTVVRGANVLVGLSMATAGLSYAYLAWASNRRGRANG